VSAFIFCSAVGCVGGILYGVLFFRNNKRAYEKLDSNHAEGTSEPRTKNFFYQMLGGGILRIGIVVASLYLISNTMTMPHLITWTVTFLSCFWLVIFITTAKVHHENSHI